jgi:hypothetical protein
MVAVIFLTRYHVQAQTESFSSLPAKARTGYKARRCTSTFNFINCFFNPHQHVGILRETSTNFNGGCTVLESLSCSIGDRQSINSVCQSVNKIFPRESHSHHSIWWFFFQSTPLFERTEVRIFLFEHLLFRLNWRLCPWWSVVSG